MRLALLTCRMSTSDMGGNGAGWVMYACATE